MYEKMYEDLLDLFKKIGIEISERVVEIYGTSKASEIIGTGAGGDKTKTIDKLAEDIIIRKISEKYDNFCIISEEIGIKFFGKKNDKECDKFFFADPIDGSNNATRGIPLFATSLSFSTSQHIEDTKVGFVKNIFGEEYYAVKGKGAYETHIQNHEEPTKLLINSNNSIEFLGVEMAPYGRNLDEISKIIRNAKHYRTVGSIALGLCYMAKNALDAYIDLRPPRILDLTAAKLIIEEAKGICFLEGKDLKVDTKAKANLIAGNKNIVENIRKILKI